MTMLALGFVLGLITGAIAARLRREAVPQGERIETAASSPMGTSAERRRIKAIIDNINSYDGTGRGQKKIV